MRPRSATKHKAILDTAASLAADLNYPEISMEAIAAGAGVGKQTLYRWWPSKAALYAEVYGNLVPRDTVSPDLGSLRNDLSAILMSLFGIFRQTSAGRILVGLIAEEQVDDSAREVVMNGLFSGRRDLLVAPLERAAKRRELPPNADIALIADGLVAMVWHRLLTLPAPPGDREAERIVDLLLKAQIDG